MPCTGCSWWYLTSVLKLLVRLRSVAGADPGPKSGQQMFSRLREVGRRGLELVMVPGHHHWAPVMTRAGAAWRMTITRTSSTSLATVEIVAAALCVSVVIITMFTFTRRGDGQWLRSELTVAVAGVCCCSEVHRVRARARARPGHQHHYTPLQQQ